MLTGGVFHATTHSNYILSCRENFWIFIKMSSKEKDLNMTKSPWW